MTRANVVFSRTLDSTTWKLGERLLVFLLTALLAVATWQMQRTIGEFDQLVHQVAEIDKRLLTVENTRFTTADGLDIQRQLTLIASKIPDRYPPREWLDDVYEPTIQRLEKNYESTAKDIREIRDSIEMIEATLRN